MPIYEFICQDCNTIFNFFSRHVNTDTRPDCPKCGRKQMKRLPSSFAAMTKTSADNQSGQAADIDEPRMEQAFAGLLQEAEQIDGEDPGRMAGLMRRFAENTGIPLGERMEDALTRLEAGADPEVIEQEMADLMDDGTEIDLTIMKKKGRLGPKPPERDDKLYELP